MPATVTAMEQELLLAITDSEFFHSDNPTADVFLFAVIYKTETVKGRRISGVVSSLVQKGLCYVSWAEGSRYGGTAVGRDDTIGLTDAGLEVVRQFVDWL